MDHVINKKASVVRVYLPPATNCLRSRHYVNVVVAGKHPAPRWLSLAPARVEVAEGGNTPNALLCQLSHTLAQAVAATAGRHSLFAESAPRLPAAQLLRRYCACSHELPDCRAKLTATQLQ